MFSFGCVLWELLSLREPWAELGGAAFQIMSKIIYERAHLRLADIPDEVRESVPGVMRMLEACFSYDAAARPSAVRAYEELEEAIESL